MADLDTYRIEINELDDQIIKLFEARMQVARNVGRYKKERNLPILNAEREALVIEKNVAKLEDKSLEDVTKRFLQTMMDLSKELQEQL
jgi:monofunctional chorismate mutase